MNVVFKHCCGGTLQIVSKKEKIMSILQNILDLLGFNSLINILGSCSKIELLGWGTACISLTGAFLNARQKWYSFLVWMVANIFWIIYDLYNGCYAQAALFMAYLSMNVYGLYCWKVKKPVKRVKEKLDSYIN